MRVVEGAIGSFVVAAAVLSACGCTKAEKGEGAMVHAGKIEELLPLEEGTRVEVVGRYEVYSPEPFAPPGAETTTARVALPGGAGVLLGEYGTPDAVRSPDERSKLGGRRVRAVGRFFHTAPWRQPYPPPSIWSGGGPQLVGIEVLEPADSD